MAEQKLATPEVTVIAAAVDGLAPPAVLGRSEQIIALWEGCLGNLTTWTSGAFLLHGGSGSGKTTCVDTLLRYLRPVADGLAQHCRIDIVELDILKMRAPNDLVQSLISHYDIAEADDPYQAVRQYIGEQDNYMLILAIENIDIGFQKEWINTLAQICHLATIGELIMIGVGRDLHFNQVADIPVLQIHFPPYDQMQTRAVLERMLLVAGLPNAINDQALDRCVLRFMDQTEELHIFYHICIEALKKTNRIQPAPLQLVLEQFANVIAEHNGVWMPLHEIQDQLLIEDQVMVQVLTEVEVFRSIYRTKAHSSKLLDLLVLKLALRNTLNVPAEDLMAEYREICQEKHTEPKNYQQIKAMCGHRIANGGMQWKHNALLIPPYASFIMEKKFIEARAVALQI